MPPRNAKAVERSQRERAEIKKLWLELQPTPLYWTPTAETIGKLLSFKLAVETVRWHMRQIRYEAAAENALTLRQCIE